MCTSVSDKNEMCGCSAVQMCGAPPPPLGDVNTQSLTEGLHQVNQEQSMRYRKKSYFAFKIKA